MTYRIFALNKKLPRHEGSFVLSVRIVCPFQNFKFDFVCCFLLEAAVT